MLHDLDIFYNCIFFNLMANWMISQHSSAEYLMQNDKQTYIFNYVFNSCLFLSNSKIAYCNKNITFYSYRWFHRLISFIEISYSSRTLRACCSQSELKILKICESRARALFLYNCTMRNFEHLAQCLLMCKHHVELIHLLHGYQYFETVKCLIYHI